MADGVSKLLAEENTGLDFRAEEYEVSLKYLKGASDLIKARGSWPVYLHFERIRGRGVIPPINVFLNVQKNRNYHDHYAGALGLYGLEQSSNGMHVILDVNELLGDLIDKPGWSDSKLNVLMKLSTKLPKDASFKIGRISLTILEGK